MRQRHGRDSLQIYLQELRQNYRLFGLIDMVTEKEVWSVLKTCYDPEIPVNIVDLGLVYELKVSKGDLHVKMTLTSPVCPLGDLVKQEITNKLMTLEGVKNVNIDLTFDPLWNNGMMSKSARRQLGMPV